MKRPLIVAEIGASHNGSYERALATVRAAAEAGADAIKLQTFTADTMVADRAAVLTDGPWKGRNLWDLYAEAAMPWEWTERLFAAAQRLGMQAWSTPYDITALAFLESIDCPRYKVASFELTATDLIAAIARTGKPIILSTGMATWEEIQAALGQIQIGHDTTLLKCTSAYPAPPDEMNLATITDMRRHFGENVGLSDHSRGYHAAVIATALGATMIEKHITLSRAGGPDDEFAIIPEEFNTLVAAITIAASAMGEPHYGPTAAEAPQYRLRRKAGGKRA